MSDRIEINKIDTVTMLVPIVGTAPLICHNFSEKSKRQMLEAQQGKMTFTDRMSSAAWMRRYCSPAMESSHSNRWCSTWLSSRAASTTACGVSEPDCSRIARSSRCSAAWVWRRSLQDSA